LQNLIELGLHHEQQHQELLITDLKYSLSFNPLLPVYSENFSLVQNENAESGTIRIDEGIYQIGFDGSGFHYDNETACHKVFLHSFEIEKGLVTNADFIEFIEAGGYQKADLWLDDGWAWVKENQIKNPLYWYSEPSDYWQFTLSGKVPVVGEHQLAHINFYEASAFAEWKDMRLPTEFEWEVAARYLNWGSRWEWTGSAYLPYPGYRKPAGAVGEYNGKFMVNQMVLRGSSNATSPDHSRPTYRNFFQPHHRWQCTGIRLAAKHQL